MESDAALPLASVVRSLRRELTAAVREGRDEEIRFALGPIELELQVNITREVGAEAKIEFWVLSAGGNAARSSGTTHTIRLSLSPVLASDVDPDTPLVIASEQQRRPR